MIAWVKQRWGVGRAGESWSSTALGCRSGFVCRQRGSNGVRKLVGISVGDSVGLFVGASVGDSVGLSGGASANIFYGEQITRI